MTPLLLFWPFWFVLVDMGVAGFVQDPSLGKASFLFVWTVTGSLNALNTWNEAREAAREWMAKERGKG